MAPSPQWYDTLGAPLPPLSFSGLAPGVASAAQTIELWNDRDGSLAADPILGARLRALAESAGQAIAQGTPALDRRALQLRVEAGLGGLEVVTTGWVAVGADAPFEHLPAEIASTEGVQIGVRVLYPSWESEADDVTILLRVDDDRAVPLGEAAALDAGILASIGDDMRPPYWWRDLVISAASPADDTITLGDALWVHGAVPYVELAEVVTISDQDSAGDPLSGAETYWVTISYGSSRTLTKGLKGSPGTKAAAPAGELLWGWVQISLTGAAVVIEAEDIERSPAANPETYEVLSMSGLDQTYSGGRSLAGGWLARWRQPQTVTHTDEATETLYRLPDGSLGLGTSPPVPRALPLWQVTATGGAITATVDRRAWLEGEEIAFDFPAPVVGQVRQLIQPSQASFWTRPHGGIWIALYDADPSALGNVAGRWAVEIERLRAGTWESLFPSSGTDDRRPEIAFDATASASRASQPERLDVAAGEQLRCRIIELPAIAGAGLAVVVRGWWERGRA